MNRTAQLILFISKSCCTLISIGFHKPLRKASSQIYLFREETLKHYCEIPIVSYPAHHQVTDSFSNVQNCNMHQTNNPSKKNYISSKSNMVLCFFFIFKAIFWGNIFNNVTYVYSGDFDCLQSRELILASSAHKKNVVAKSDMLLLIS